MHTRMKADSLNFNPRSPWGERRWNVVMAKDITGISIHAPRGGSDKAKEKVAEFCRISIHAPRGGSDLYIVPSCPSVLSISIHAPRGGSDLFCSLILHQISVFQSTLPVGGATAKMHSFPCPSLARITKVGEKTARKAHYNVKNNGCRQFSHKKVRAKLWGNFCSLALRS